MIEQLKFSDLVRGLRQQLGLSQEKFAAKLGGFIPHRQLLGWTCSAVTNGAEAN